MFCKKVSLFETTLQFEGAKLIFFFRKRIKFCCFFLKSERILIRFLSYNASLLWLFLLLLLLKLNSATTPTITIIRNTFLPCVVCNIKDVWYKSLCTWKWIGYIYSFRRNNDEIRKLHHHIELQYSNGRVDNLTVPSSSSQLFSSLYFFIVKEE